MAHSSLQKVKRKRCSISSFIKRCASKAAGAGMVARKAATLAWLRLSKAHWMSNFTKMGVAVATDFHDGYHVVCGKKGLDWLTLTLRPVVL